MALPRGTVRERRARAAPPGDMSDLEALFWQIWMARDQAIARPESVDMGFLKGIELKREVIFLPHRQSRADFAHLSTRVAIEMEGVTDALRSKGKKKSRHVTISGYDGDCWKYSQMVMVNVVVLRFTRTMLDGYVHRGRLLYGPEQVNRMVYDAIRARAGEVQASLTDDMTAQQYLKWVDQDFKL